MAKQAFLTHSTYHCVAIGSRFSLIPASGSRRMITSADKLSSSFTTKEESRLARVRAIAADSIAEVDDGARTRETSSP